MAKRTRGRREQRRAARRSVAPPRAAAFGPTAAPAPHVPTATKTDRAPLAPPTVPSPNVLRTGAGRPSSILAARAAEEYRYVAADVRRIVTVVGILLAVLLALWLAIEVAGLVRI